MSLFLPFQNFAEYLLFIGPTAVNLRLPNFRIGLYLKVILVNISQLLLEITVIVAPFCALQTFAVLVDSVSIRIAW